MANGANFAKTFVFVLVERNTMTADKVAEANRMLNEGRFDSAAKLYLSALESDGSNLDAAYGLGTLAMNIGQFPKASEIAAQLTSAKPDDARYLQLAGDSAMGMGRAKDAIPAYRQILALDPQDEIIRKRLIGACLPGAYYYDVLAQLHPYLNPSTYIEIGVANGRSLALAQPECRAVGIDPEPVIDPEYQSDAEIFVETSDAFFEEEDIPQILGQDHFDLAFVDGLHTFDQALRDFINLTKYASPTSIILIHDCYPLDTASCQRDRQTNIWSGDVWKVICALKHAVPDIDLVTVKAPPTGLGLAKNCDGLFEALDRQYDDLVEKFENCTFEWLNEDPDRRLNAVPNDWSLITNHLGTAIPH